jgi:glycine C-acetyltransferase
MYDSIRRSIEDRLAEARSSGVYKQEAVITTAQSAHIRVDGGTTGELLNLCANNYLGLADHPELIAAASSALQRWGLGTASVRFICGTQSLHRELEARLAGFLAKDDAILFSSCFDANGGLFEALLSDEDAVISDALNHASIIDGIRLCKARRFRYANGDMDELEARLRESSNLRYRLIATDGVFSMDGYLAKLDQICDLADRYDALVMVDDSHAVGFVGPNGRGTPEHYGVEGRVDILTGTFGKALGGAGGGYVAGRREIIELLRQQARPYLFSNSIAPAIAAATLKALDLVDESPVLRDRLRSNTRYFRSRMTELGFEVLPGEHPIVPIMVGDEVVAQEFSRTLFSHGVYAVSFSYPVVPRGMARIRTQMSTAHSTSDLDFAIAQFIAARPSTIPEANAE